MPFENRHLSFACNQHKDPAYLAIDRWPLTEVAGILLYLARPFPQAGILPVGDIEAEAALGYAVPTR